MNPNLIRVADSAGQVTCPPGKASGGQPLAEGEEQSAIEEPTSWVGGYSNPLPASQSSWEPVDIPGLEGCLMRTLTKAECENLPDDSSSSVTSDSSGRSTGLASTPASLATIAKTRELIYLAAMPPEDEDLVHQALDVLTMYCEDDDWRDKFMGLTNHLWKVRLDCPWQGVNVRSTDDIDS